MAALSANSGMYNDEPYSNQSATLRFFGNTVDKLGCEYSLIESWNPFAERVFTKKKFTYLIASRFPFQRA